MAAPAGLEKVLIEPESSTVLPLADGTLDRSARATADASIGL
jgi:hypothetical protein